MAKATRTLPKLQVLKKPILVGAPARDQTWVNKILKERLDLLCAEFDIKSAAANRYRELCIVLLADVIGVRGFQVVHKLPRGRGATIQWTAQQHFALVQFVNDQLAAGAKRDQAFGLARDKFDPNLTDGSIKTEYYEGKRLLAALPRINALLALEHSANGLPLGTNFGKFIETRTRLKLR